MTASFFMNLVYWLAGVVVIAEALNKIERTELFSIDTILRERLALLKASTGGRFERFVNRAKCAGWRLVSMRDRAVALLRSGGWRERFVDILKLAGWALLSTGAGGALINPLSHFHKPGLADVCTLAGFAVLIIRTRVREGVR